MAFKIKNNIDGILSRGAKHNFCVSRESTSFVPDVSGILDLAANPDTLGAGNGVVLTWSTPTANISFTLELQRSTPDNNSYIDIFDVTGLTNYTDNSTADNTFYYYAIITTTATFQQQSNEVTITSGSSGGGG